MNIDWTLIKKSLHTTLAPNEQEQLNQWLEESPTHKRLYHDIQQYTIHTHNFHPSVKELQQFRTTYIKRLETVQKQNKYHQLYSKVQIAAIFTLPIVIALSLLFHKPDKQETLIATKIESPMPGSPKATLITESGDKVKLNEENSKELKPGIRIDHKAHQLIYDIDTSHQTKQAINRLLTPRGGEYSVSLSDGTKVWLNADSELEYPVQFSKNIRKVHLKGEAYFEVTHNHSQAFIVATDGIEVKVYGTEFNINTRTPNSIQTTLVNGSIAIHNKELKEIKIQPNQMAEYNRTTGKVEIKDVDVNDYIGWKSGIYIFENRTVEQIMKELSLWYDTEVFYTNNEAKNKRFSGILPRFKNIEELLRVIEKTTYVKFEIKGNTIIVK